MVEIRLCISPCVRSTAYSACKSSCWERLAASSKLSFRFKYFFNRGKKEEEVEFNANSDEDAVKQFYFNVGLYEFGCIREDGTSFTDDNYLELKGPLKHNLILYS